MTKIIKIIAVLAIFLTLGMNISMAQTYPQFIINCTGCELANTHYTTDVTYAIIEIPNGGTPSVVYGPETNTVVYPYTELDVINMIWDCDQSTEKNQYMIIIHVDRYDENHNLVCSGDLRTSPMPCSELYNNDTYTVSLN